MVHSLVSTKFIDVQSEKKIKIIKKSIAFFKGMTHNVFKLAGSLKHGTQRLKNSARTG